MNKITLIFIIGFLSLNILSCQTKKVTIDSESKFYTDSVYSENLSEYRKHNVYLPNQFDNEKQYPIIYATDGSETTSNNVLKTILDSLIENKIIKPVIYVSSYSNQKIADSTSTTLGNGKKVYLQYRNFEYVNRKPDRIEDSLLVNRYENHMLYFKDELTSYVERKLNQKPKRKDRFFYGVSNGAGFGLSLLNTYPNIIGTYICYSTFGGDIQSNLWKADVDYPDLYLQYGSDEPFFLKDDAEFLKSKYKELNLFAEMKEFNGGHDNEKWNEEFTKTISKLLATE